MTTTAYSRYHSLDLSRGIAVLAILVVNIWAFALPFSAYGNPSVYGDMTGANYWSWLLSFVLVQEKFITIFSMLFGAGVALFVDHARARGESAATLHYRRMAALLVIGLLHAYGLWSGDILTAYAVLGMVLFLFLRCADRTLLLWALGLIGLSLLLLVLFAVSLPKLPAADLAELSEFWQPPAAQIAEEIANYRSGWWQQMQTRVPTTLELQTMLLSFYSIRLLAQMLLGVYLYRSGFLTGRWSASAYRWCALFGVGMGLAMAYRGAIGNVEAGFAFAHAMGFGQLWNNVGSLIAALGYLSLFVLWSQSSFAPRSRQLLEQAGRTGFTLYLGSTLICTTLFYGHGFGLFASLDRFALFAIVLAIWALLLLFAHLWLARFRQGPLEALWRYCTYGKR